MEILLRCRESSVIFTNSNRNFIILGMSFMRQKQIIFDLDKRELGIVPANCSHDANEMIIPKFGRSDASSRFLRIFRKMGYWLIGAIGSGIILLLLMISYVKRVRRAKKSVEYKCTEMTTLSDTSEVQIEDETYDKSESEIDSVIDEIII